MAGSYGKRLAGVVAVCMILAAAVPAATITLTPTDDVWVRGGDYGDDEYGVQPTASRDLTVKYEPGSPGYTRETFLRFDLSGIGGSVDSASLTLTVKSQNTTNNGLQYVKAVNDDNWAEADVSYNTRPTDYAASPITSWYIPANGETVTLDITSAVNAETDGKLSLIIYADDSRYMTYYSKDGNTFAQRPHLRIRGSAVEAPGARGRILMEYWTGIAGSAITDLTGNANYPDRPFSRDYPTVFESVAGFGDNYGTRFRGYVHAPQTGSYTFYIASDNDSELYLSSDDNPANIGSAIASVTGYASRYEWDKYASQASSPVVLVAGQRYYVEVRHVEGTGSDHVEVGWQLPDASYERPITGERLSPYYDTEWIVVDADIFDRQATGHPRLMASAHTFARLAEEMSTDTDMELRYLAVQEQADALLDVAPSTYTTARMLSISRTVLSRLKTLSLAYHLSGDTDYLDRAWDEMESVANFADWGVWSFLDVSEMTMAMAIGYDWLYNDLTTAQRATIRNSIKVLGLQEGLAAYQANVWWSRSADNWNQVCNGGMAAGAMAIYEDEPAVASDILEYVLDSCTLENLCPDGGWREGPSYWNYAMSYATYLLAAMETNFGTTFGIAGRAGMSEAGLYPIYVDRPTGLVFNYGDCGTGGMPSVHQIYWMSKRFNRPEFAAWQRDQFRYVPREILWWDPRGETPDEIPLSLDRKFDSCGIATLRGGWDSLMPSFVGFKAGTNAGGHWQMDLGSVVIDALGEAFVLDLGSNDYGYYGGVDSDYFNANRYKFYKVRAEGHNTLVINPDADRDQVSVSDAPLVNYVSNGEGAQAMVDLSPAYAGDATSVVRGVRMMDYKRSILIQDEISGVGGDQEVYWFMHTKAAIDIVDAGQTAVFEQNGKRLWAHILSAPAGAEFTTMTATPLPTSPVPDGGQDSTEGYQKLVLHISDVSAMTLAVLLVPLDIGENPPASLPSVVALSNWSSYAYNADGSGFGGAPHPSHTDVAVPADWDAAAGAVTFQIYSGTNNNQGIPVIFHSENAATTGIDYYYKMVTADWLGWKRFVFPQSDFTPVRSPLGWDQLTNIQFWTYGWGGATRLDDSVLQVAGVQSIPTGTPFGQLPAETFDLMFAPPEDWDAGKEYLGFDLYSKVANNQKLLLLLMSENPDGIPTGPDYYTKTIYVDWTGWKHFCFPLSSMGVARQPRGFDQIDEVRFYTNGWATTIEEDTLLSLDHFGTVVGGENFGAAPAENTDATPDLPTGWQPYGRVTFDMYSEEANYQTVNVIFYSENPSTGGEDYYIYTLTVDWTGWRTLEIPTLDFTVVGEPLGWDQITDIRFDTNSYAGATLLTDTFLSIRDIDTDLDGSNFGASPMASSGVNVAVPAGWMAYGYLALDLYSQSNNGQEVIIACSSENAADPAGWDYFSKKITVNWSGWQHLEIPLSEFTVNRSPLGWDQLDYIAFHTTGWSMTLLEDTYLSVRNVENVLEGQHFGATPSPANWVHVDVPAGWLSYGYLTLDLYSEANNGQEVIVACSSENAADPAGWDYFSKKITVNWSGWQHIEIPLTDFTVVRNPLGWDQIDYIAFHTTGWSMTLLDDTHLSVRNVENELEGQHFGATPSPADAARVDLPPGWDYTDGEISFSLYSESANGQIVGVNCSSENAEGVPEGWDYYRYATTADWVGWQNFTVSFTSFTAVRQPLGWDQIDYVSFTTTGWGTTQYPDTHLSVKDMRSGD